jgi:iron complex outermembrane receptor protein
MILSHKKYHQWFLLILIFLFCHGTEYGYSQRIGRLTGRIIDRQTQKPLHSADLILMKTVLGTSSDAEGRFFLERIPIGTYTLRITMMGYQSITTQEIHIEAEKTTELLIPMEPTVIDLDPIIVTASKHSQSLSTSHQAVHTLPSTQIIQRQNRDLEDNLTPIPGIHFNETNISIRGSSGYSVYNVGSRILLMVDGVPSLTSDLGAINWEILPFLDVESIEVVKGAGSALYGSSAIGGIVNILTRKPSQKGSLRFRVLTGVFDQPHYPEWHWTQKTLHYERFDINYSRQFGPVGFRINASRYQSTGYMENDSTRQWNLSGRFQIQLPWHHSCDLYIAWMKAQRDWLIQWLNQNRPFEVPPFNKDDEFHYETTNIYFRYHLPLGSRLAFHFRFSHLFSLMGSQIIGERGSPYDPQAFDPGQGLGIEVQGVWLPSNHHITFGGEYRRDISGSRYFGHHRGYTISGYLQEEWALLSQVQTTLGLRLDHHTLVGEESYTRLSPKFGFNYRPWTGTTFRFTGGSGFRAATVFEKYIKADYSGFNVIPNPDLKPETSWFWDLGIRQTISDCGHIEMSLFQTDYWNMIEPVINFLGTIQFQNRVRARIPGLELGGEWWVWNKRVGFQGSLTWMDPRDIERNRLLSYRPKFTATLTGHVRLGSLLAQMEYRFASRIQEVEINPLDPRVPLKLLYGRVQYQWQHLIFQLAVNNALNYHYTQIERRMGEIRSFTFGIIGKF